jgi:hypothetical protein
MSRATLDGPDSWRLLLPWGQTMLDSAVSLGRLTQAEADALGAAGPALSLARRGVNGQLRPDRVWLDRAALLRAEAGESPRDYSYHWRRKSEKPTEKNMTDDIDDMDALNLGKVQPDELEFWRGVYSASIRCGHGPGGARREAQKAVMDLRRLTKNSRGPSTPWWRTWTTPSRVKPASCVCEPIA